jgi:hemerythrin-like domain-containing protein
MMPVGPLMIEHRLIERMIGVMRAHLESIRKEGRVDPVFVDTAVDFIRTYADRCHHGKEEDILFRDLAGKKLSDAHRRIMGELVEEHKMGRANVKELVEAKEKYVRGDQKALKDIVSGMGTLVDFYPKHIEKEDKRFFLPCMKYFRKEEQAAMLNEFREFDMKLIHVKYKAVVSGMEIASGNR